MSLHDCLVFKVIHCYFNLFCMIEELALEKNFCLTLLQGFCAESMMVSIMSFGSLLVKSFNKQCAFSHLMFFEQLHR